MNVKRTQIPGQIKIRQSTGMALRQNPGLKTTMPKPPTARLKIINGRPYYYAVVNIWDKYKQRCHQVSKYLGKELPKGYRLIK